MPLIIAMQSAGKQTGSMRWYDGERRTSNKPEDPFTVENTAVVYRRTSQQPGGVERQHCMTLARAAGTITQTGEHSDDAGKTWQRDFQLTYVKRAA